MSSRRFAHKQISSAAQPSIIVTHAANLSPVCGLPEEIIVVVLEVVTVPFPAVVVIPVSVAEAGFVLVPLPDARPVDTASEVVSATLVSVVALVSV